MNGVAYVVILDLEDFSVGNIRIGYTCIGKFWYLSARLVIVCYLSLWGIEDQVLLSPIRGATLKTQFVTTCTTCFPFYIGCINVALFPLLLLWLTQHTGLTGDNHVLDFTGGYAHICGLERCNLYGLCCPALSIYAGGLFLFLFVFSFGLRWFCIEMISVQSFPSFALSFCFHPLILFWFIQYYS